MSRFPLLPLRVNEGTIAVDTPTKLNLFLEVLAQRPDGFHEIETLFLALDIGDRLRVSPAAGRAGKDTLSVRGSPAPTDESNLVLRALRRARESRSIPALAIALEKRIPAGTGLGGGSGNAAGMLAILDHLVPDPRGIAGVRADAADLGSDVAFFLSESAAAIGRGRGERLAPFPGTLFGGDVPAFVIVLPEVHSSTAAAYRGIALALTSESGPITFPTRTFEVSGEWQRGLFNRLEARVIKSVPQLAELSRHLRLCNLSAPDSMPRVARSGLPSTSESETLAVQMTGSGSAFFIVGEDLAHAQRIDAALCAPDGPLEAFTRSSGVVVTTRVARPHPHLLPA